MICCVKGILSCSIKLESGLGVVVVECKSGISFEFKTSAITLEKCCNIGAEIMLYTYLSVKENSVDLFGFFEKQEQECFKMLISVSGVGPSFGLAILSALSPSQLFECVRLEDSKTLAKCKGIGLKTAGRIILELKNKIPENMFSGFSKRDLIGMKSRNVDEAVDALVALGFGKKEALLAVSSQEDCENKTVENLIKDGFKFLAN